MTLTHVFYIPVVVLLGFAVGYVLGARAGRAEVLRQQAQSKR
jgi:hypothetical protein